MKTLVTSVMMLIVLLIYSEPISLDFNQTDTEISETNIEYQIKMVTKIDSCFIDGLKESTYFRSGFILDNRLYLYSAYEKSVVSFELSELSNDMTPIDEFFLQCGKGPGEISFVMDMQTKDNKIFISDGNNNRINVYDNEFNSIETIKTEFRPAKLSLFGSVIAINTYDGVMSTELGCIYNETDKTFESLVNIEATSNNNLSVLMANNTITEFDVHGNIYLVRKYPDFSIHKFTDRKYVKSFASAEMSKTKLPVPEFKVFRNDRKIWGLSTYKDIEYIDDLNMLVTMSITGWEELADENGLTNILTGYDDSGNVVMEYHFPEYIPDESCSILYDIKSNILLVISGSIYVFDVRKI